MGIEIKIRQPENKIDIYRIEELWKNACTNVFEGETNPRIGVQDNFYRMQLQFINTSKEGFAHANDVSAYSFVAISRIAKEIDLLNENASLVCLTYHGSTKVLPNYNIMGVAKAALECSVRYLADNLGKEGIRVNAVSAGPIKTLSAKGIKDFSSIQTVVEEKAPLRRNVTKEEVGNVATFLFSDMSSAVTGQVLYADSGYSIMGI